MRGRKFGHTCLMSPGRWGRGPPGFIRDGRTTGMLIASQGEPMRVGSERTGKRLPWIRGIVAIYAPTPAPV